MTSGQTEPAYPEPSPLDRDEITAVIGAVMIVAGVFCPALTLTESFLATGNTVGALVMGLAGATGWSIALRRPAAVMWNGLMTVVIVATFGIALWYDEVREPARTFFGMIQAEFRPIAWILIGIGGALVALAGYRAGGRDQKGTKFLTPSQLQTIAGLILATLGCLFAIALTNPFGSKSSGSLREMGRSWDNELNVVRWLLMIGAMFAVVLCAQVPRLADQVLRAVTGITWLIVGNALFVSLSIWSTASLYLLLVVWNITFFGLLLWKTSARRAWSLWERLILWLPYQMFGVLLLLRAGAFDFLTIAGPPVVAIATGNMICRRAKWAGAATYAAMLLLGIPAAGMAFGGMPIEFLEPCGLSTSEVRVMLLILASVLAWSIFLSIWTAPAVTPVAEADTTWRRSDGSVG